MFPCVTVLLLLASFAFRAPLLRGAAALWIVDAPAEAHYDVAIVPGGGLQTRPFAAAEFYREGRVGEIVSFLTEVLPAEALGLTRPSDQVTLEILDKLEVPREKIRIIGNHVTSTQDEVEAVRDWALESEVSSIVVLTEIFPSRRVSYAYGKAFRGTGIDVAVHSITPRSYSAANWWQHEQGLISFQNEVIKYFYYRLRH